MRVAHVVTVFTPENAFGGPVTVAVNQGTALHARGHSVTLLASALGLDSPYPRSVNGVDLQLFPARRLLPYTGFAGLIAPGVLGWLIRNRRQIDIVHVHLARDLVTLPAAALAHFMRIPYVVQTHGMIDPSPRRLARLLDAVATRKLLRSARCVLVLTPRERHDVASVAQARVRISSLPNGVPKAEPSGALSSRREVLFLARLHTRKRPAVFVQAALSLAPHHPEASFVLVGPDEGAAPEVQRALEVAHDHGSRVRWEGPIAPGDVRARMEKCAVYVLPSVDEPFPMSVLEAMSLGKPVVVTDSCGLAPAIRRAKAGLVIGTEPFELQRALNTLLRDPDLGHAMGQRGRRLVEAEYGMDAIADQLEKYYHAATATTGREISPDGS